MSQLEAAVGCDPILWYRVPTVKRHFDFLLLCAP